MENIFLKCARPSRPADHGSCPHQLRARHENKLSQFSVSYIVSPGHDGSTEPPGGEGDGGIAYSEPYLLTGMVYSHGLGKRKQNAGKQTEKI